MVYVHNAPCTLKWCSSTTYNALSPMVRCTFIMNYKHWTLLWFTSTMHKWLWTFVQWISTVRSTPLNFVVWSSNMHCLPWYSAIPLCIMYVGIVQSHLLVLFTLLRCTSTTHLTHWHDVVPPFTMHRILWYGALSSRIMHILPCYDALQPCTMASGPL